MGDLLHLVRAVDPTVSSIVSSKSIARLWAGMGSIEELTCCSSSKTTTASTTIIAKRIRCPHPDSDTDKQISFGDRRKAESYRVEAHWYESHANDPALAPVCCRGLLWFLPWHQH